MKHKILATLFLIASSLFSSKTASACTPTPVYSQYTVRSNDTSTIYQNVQVTGYSSCADSMNSFTHTPYISNFITMGLNGDYSDMSVTTALATDNFAYSSGELHIVSASKWTANVGQMSVVSGGVVEGTS